MDKTFKFSEETIKQRKKLMIVMAIIMLVAIVFFSIFLSSIDEIKNIWLFIKIISVMAAIMIIEIVIVSRIMFKKLRTMEIIVTEKTFVRQGGKFIEAISFNDLIRVKVSTEPSGKIAFIKLKTRKKSFSISGFESMDILVENIKEKLEDSSILIIKKWKVNWNNPITSVIAGIITMIIIALLMRFSLSKYEIFNRFLIIGFALFLLIYRPISRNSGKRFRILELVSGILMLVGSALIFIGNMLH
ncbi:hypothetical protein [Clostridium sp. DL1XJH146]